MSWWIPGIKRKNSFPNKLKIWKNSRARHFLKVFTSAWDGHCEKNPMGVFRVLACHQVTDQNEFWMFRGNFLIQVVRRENVAGADAPPGLWGHVAQTRVAVCCAQCERPHQGAGDEGSAGPAEWKHVCACAPLRTRLQVRIHDARQLRVQVRIPLLFFSRPFSFAIERDVPQNKEFYYNRKRLCAFLSARELCHNSDFTSLFHSSSQFQIKSSERDYGGSISKKLK